jgi:acetyl esterase/lipase
MESMMKTQTMSLLTLAVLTVGAIASPPPERVSLWQGRAPAGGGAVVGDDAFITVHRPETPTGAAVMICPGGAYEVLCVEPEGHGIARWLNAHGITGVVLEYRLPKGNRFVPLLDVQRALRMTRVRAEAWGCDPRRIGILGFSAGGHLASTAATRFDAGRPDDPDPVNRMSCRPDFAILIYPVITMGAHTHGGSKRNLLGPDPDPAVVEQFSNEKQVTAETPPAFLAHAKDDTAVPPVNSRMFIEALQAHGVTGRYLELPNGGHGLNWYKGPSWDAWQRESLVWLEEIGMKPADRPAGANTAGVGG